MSFMDDTVARYDPLEAVMQIADVTGEDERTVAQVLTGLLVWLFFWPSQSCPRGTRSGKAGRLAPRSAIATIVPRWW